MSNGSTNKGSIMYATPYPILEREFHYSRPHIGAIIDFEVEKVHDDGSSIVPVIIDEILIDAGDGRAKIQGYTTTHHDRVTVFYHYSPARGDKYNGRMVIHRSDN